MVIVDGIRYRDEDVKRLGLVADATDPKPEKDRPVDVSHKARRPARNGGTRGARTSGRSR